MTQVTCWMISWKKSYLRVFGLGNFLNFLNVQDWSEERGLPRFSKRQVSESLFDLKDPKRFQRWLNVPSFPNILQTLQDIPDIMMKLNPHQSWADMSWMDQCHWERDIGAQAGLETKYLLHKVHFTASWNLTYWSKSGLTNSLQWKCFSFCYEIAENSKKTIHSRITPWICNFDLFVTFMRALKRWWILKISKISIFEEEKIICDTWFYTRCTWLWLKLEIFWNFFEHNNWMFNDPSKVTLVFLFCKNYFGPAQVQMVVISISL